MLFGYFLLAVGSFLSLVTAATVAGLYRTEMIKSRKIFYRLKNVRKRFAPWTRKGVRKVGRRMRGGVASGCGRFSP